MRLTLVFYFIIFTSIVNCFVMSTDSRFTREIKQVQRLKLKSFQDSLSNSDIKNIQKDEIYGQKDKQVSKKNGLTFQHRYLAQEQEQEIAEKNQQIENKTLVQETAAPPAASTPGDSNAIPQNTSIENSTSNSSSDANPNELETNEITKPRDQNLRVGQQYPYDSNPSTSDSSSGSSGNSSYGTYFGIGSGVGALIGGLLGFCRGSNKNFGQRICNAMLGMIIGALVVTLLLSCLWLLCLKQKKQEEVNQ